MIKSHSKPEILKHIKRLNLEEMFNKNLLDITELHTFDEMEVVMYESDPCKYFYILVEGTLRVSTSSAYGRSILLDYIPVGSILGDIEFATRSNTLNTVIAVSQAKIIVIPEPAINNHLENNLAFYKLLSTIMGEKLKASSLKCSGSALHNAKSLVSGYILQRKCNTNSNTFTYRSASIAEFYGLSERHTRRVLSQLANEDLIKLLSKQIVILNEAGLHRYADD
jgi:CRP/FNR family transcriptional regulator, putaive post-exponential-phase nitrogen-starvation regulator